MDLRVALEVQVPKCHVTAAAVGIWVGEAHLAAVQGDPQV